MTQVTLSDEQEEAVRAAVFYVTSRLQPADPFLLADAKEMDDDELPEIPDCGPMKWSCAGLAGTGKTTVLVEVVRRLRALKYRVAVGAFTGKAVGVINGKQHVFIARTLHSLFTRRASSKEGDEIQRQLDELMTFEREVLPGLPEKEQKVEAEKLSTLTAQLDAELEKLKSDIKFQPKTAQEFYFGVRYRLPNDEFGDEQFTRGPGFDLVVIDEASMVSQRLDMELMHGVTLPMLYFGDNHQLPPVEEDPRFKACVVNLDAATHTLRQIHRQAETSGIIRVAHVIAKEGKYPAADFAAQFGDVHVTDQMDLAFAAQLAPTHQILCFTNKVRMALGPMTRVACGLPVHPETPWMPCVGEHLTVDVNAPKHGVMRGSTVEVLEVKPLIAGQSYETYLQVDGVKTNTETKQVAAYETRCFTVWARFRKLGDDKNEIAYFLNCNEPAECYDSTIRSTPTKNKLLRSSFGMRVQFGRVGTVHKAQGSEWKNVVYYGDMPTHHQDWSRHAYTGVTRAREALVICSRAFKKQRSLEEILAEKSAKRRQYG